MIYALMGYLHAAVERRVRRVQSLAAGETGQGTVEYVGLILLVSLLMVGMVAAMKGFNRNRSKTRNLKQNSADEIETRPQTGCKARNLAAPSPGHRLPRVASSFSRLGTTSSQGLGAHPATLALPRGWGRRPARIPAAAADPITRSADGHEWGVEAPEHPHHRAGEWSARPTGGMGLRVDRPGAYSSFAQYEHLQPGAAGPNCIEEIKDVLSQPDYAVVVEFDQMTVDLEHRHLGVEMSADGVAELPEIAPACLSDRDPEPL